MRAVAQHLEDALVAMGKCDWEDMEVFVNDLKMLPDMSQTISRIYRTLARKAESELPVGTPERPKSGVVEMIDRMAGVGDSMARCAEEVHPRARREFEYDLTRRENPRTGEHKWNVKKST